MDYQLSPTSALVLLWAEKDSYHGQIAKRFFDTLDLSSGRPLLHEMNEIWSHYDQVIKNRKFGVWDYVNGFIEKNTPLQVVCLGGGLDPISIQVAETFSTANVFDVDLHNMDLKSEIALSIGAPSNLQFVTADVADGELLCRSLASAGWKKEKKSLVIAEGLSYYIQKSNLLKSLKLTLNQGSAQSSAQGNTQSSAQGNTQSSAQGNTQSSALIMEYLTPIEKVHLNQRYIPNRVFKKIREKYQLPQIVTYSHSDIEFLKSQLKAISFSSTNMHDLEYKRIGSNIFFPEKDSGWIGISLIQL